MTCFRGISPDKCHIVVEIQYNAFITIVLDRSVKKDDRDAGAIRFHADGVRCIGRAGVYDVDDEQAYILIESRIDLGILCGLVGGSVIFAIRNSGAYKSLCEGCAD